MTEKQRQSGLFKLIQQTVQNQRQKRDYTIDDPELLKDCSGQISNDQLVG